MATWRKLPSAGTSENRIASAKAQRATEMSSARPANSGETESAAHTVTSESSGRLPLLLPPAMQAFRSVRFYPV